MYTESYSADVSIAFATQEMFPNRDRINQWLLWPMRGQSSAHRQFAVWFALVFSLVSGTAVSAYTRRLVGPAVWLTLSLVIYLVAYYMTLLFFAALAESAGGLTLPELQIAHDASQWDFGGRLIRIGACGGLVLISLLATIGNVRALYNSKDIPVLLGAIAGTISLIVIGATGAVSLSLVGRPKLVLFFISGNAACLLLAIVSFTLQPNSLAAFVAAWCAFLVVVPLLRANYWWGAAQ
jgi:hypothetical protein